MKKIITFITVAAVLMAAYITNRFIDTFDPESVKGKYVVVTGASTGIGEELAYQYARLGANIVITARREHRLKEVVEKCKGEGPTDGSYHYIPLDMEDKDSPSKLISFAEEKFGTIDTLVLNHALGPSLIQWLDTPHRFKNLQKVFDINFFAYVSVVNHALPLLEKSRGSVVILNSINGKMSQPYTIEYSATKHALEGFFGGLQLEFTMTNKDIAITMCTLGAIDTEVTTKVLEKFPNMKNLVTAENITDTALAVIKGGAQRLQRVYFPYLEARIMGVYHQLIPETSDKISAYSWRK